MDNILINNKKHLFVFIAIIIAFLCCPFVIMQSNIVAYADAPIMIINMTSEVPDEDMLFNNNIIEWNTVEYENENVYGRNITIKYQLSGVSYLKFDTKIGNEEIITGVLVPTNGATTYSYKVDKNGIVNVFCYAYNDLQEEIGLINSTVKSDITAPDNFAKVNTMDKYIGNILYDVTINWDNFSDELSGKGKVFYNFIYASDEITDIGLSEVDISNVNATTFSISNNGTLTIFHFDNASNSLIKQYNFDKFDFAPPPVPVITITPNVDTAFTDGYAREYFVTIDYALDALSGNAEIQKYSVNNKNYDYHQGFTLSGAINYSIKAYSMDNVGNASETTVATISSSSFDDFAPLIINKVLMIDLTKPIIASLSIDITDTQSGVATAAIDSLSINFVKGYGDTYKAEFNPNKLSSIVIKVTDKVGNTTFEHLIINYFDIEKLSDKIISYNTKYLEFDKSLYNEQLLNQIDKEYGVFNTMLISASTQEGQIYSEMDKIDALFEGRSEHTYTVASVPLYLSTMIRYKVTESDFENYKKGDSVNLVFSSEVSNDDNYKKISGYKSYFADLFSLRILYKGNEVEQLDNGLEITMNLPNGDYERNFTLYNMNTKEIVDTTIVNNQIVFNCKEGASYALIISGKNEIALANATKYIKLFGKKLDYGTFFGVVFGVIGATALIIVVIIVLKKKRS